MASRKLFAFIRNFIHKNPPVVCCRTVKYSTLSTVWILTHNFRDRSLKLRSFKVSTPGVCRHLTSVPPPCLESLFSRNLAVPSVNYPFLLPVACSCLMSFRRQIRRHINVRPAPVKWSARWRRQECSFAPSNFSVSLFHLPPANVGCLMETGRQSVARAIQSITVPQPS